MRRVPLAGAVALLAVLVAGSPVAGAPRGPVSVREPADITTTQPVDFNGDVYSDLAIGAPGEDLGTGYGAGAVNLQYGSASGLAGGGVLTQGNPEADDQFGAALAKGIFNADDFVDLAVGAPGEDLGTTSNAGAVVVFYGSATGLTGAGQVIQQANPEVGDAFGTALDTGDFNDDGFFDLAVGAPGEGVGGTGAAGAVSIFYGSAVGLAGTAAQNLVQSNPENGDSLGAALDAGFYDGDFGGDLAVGAPGETVGLAGAAGAVTVFYSDGIGGFGGPGQVIVQGNPEVADFFGSAIAGGAFDGSGPFDLVVGAPGEVIAGGGFATGAVSLFHGLPGGVSGINPRVILQGAGGLGGAAEGDDRFGAALAVGVFDGDGTFDLAVGAPGENIGVGISNGGAVNVLYGSAGGLVADDQVFLQGSLGVGGTPESGDQFGAALAKGVYYNDFDADGFTDLAVGAPGENVGTGNTAGAVNLLYGSAGGLDGASLVYFQGADLGGGASVGGSAEPGDFFGAGVD